MITSAMLSDWFSRARLLQLVRQPDPLRLLLHPFPQRFHQVVWQKAEQQQYQVNVQWLPVDKNSFVGILD